MAGHNHSISALPQRGGNGGRDRDWTCDPTRL